MARKYAGNSAAHGLAKALAGYGGDDLSIVVDKGGARYDPTTNTIYLPGLPGQDVDGETADSLRAYLAHEAYERKGAGADRQAVWTYKLRAKSRKIGVDPSILHPAMNAVYDVFVNRSVLKDFPGAGIAILRTLRHHYGKVEGKTNKFSPINRVLYAFTSVQYGFKSAEEARAILTPEERAAAGALIRKLPLNGQEECWTAVEEIFDALKNGGHGDAPEPQTGPGKGEPGEDGEPQDGEGEPQDGEGEGAGDGPGGEGDTASPNESAGEGGAGVPDLTKGEGFDPWQEVTKDINEATGEKPTRRNESGVWDGQYQYRGALDHHPSHDPANQIPSETYRKVDERIFEEDLAEKSIAATLTQRLRDTLTTTAPDWSRRKDKGRIDPRRVAALATGTSPNVFRRRTAQEKVDTAVLVVCDRSGSMGNMEEARSLMWALNEALGRLDIPCGIYGYDGSDPVRVTLVKEWTDHYAADVVRTRLTHLSGSGGTPTAAAMGWALEEIAKRPERRRIVLFMTDGGPNGKPGAYSYIRTVADRMAEAGVEFIPVAMGVDAIGAMILTPIFDLNKTVKVESFADLRSKVADALVKRLRANSRRVESAASTEDPESSVHHERYREWLATIGPARQAANERSTERYNKRLEIERELLRTII